MRKNNKNNKKKIKMRKSEINKQRTRKKTEKILKI